MKMILLIDDSRDGLGYDIVARNSTAGLAVLKACQEDIDELHIDFDLGCMSKHDGLFVVRRALRLGILPDKVVIVSSLPHGRKMIQELLIANGFAQTKLSRYERKMQ